MPAEPTKPLKTINLINPDDYGYLILASSQEEAQVAVGDEYELEFEGWFQDVGWDRENYALKRDFVRQSGFTGWWEGCRAPADGQEGKKLRRGWAATWIEPEGEATDA